MGMNEELSLGLSIKYILINKHMAIMHHVMTLFPGLFGKDWGTTSVPSFYSCQRVYTPFLKQQAETGWPGEDASVCFFMQTLLSWWYFFSFLFILNYYLFIVHGCSWVQAYYGQCVKVRGQFLRFCSLLLPWILGIKLMFQVCKTSTFTC